MLGVALGGEARLLQLVGFFTLAKMSCLCAPTTHAGSFRCRLHRSNSWGGRSISRPTFGEDLETSTASLIENSLQINQKPNVKKTVASAPLPPRSPSARSPRKGGSRLRNVVSSSDEEDEVIKPSVPITERMPTMKMATGTGGSFSSAPGGPAAMFRMLKTGQSPSKIFS